MKRKEQKELTRRKVYETSLQLMVRNGYEQVTVDEIVEAAGVSKGTFYHHFLTKSAVLLEYGNQLHGDLLDRVKRSASDGGELGEEQLRSFFHAVIDFYAHHFEGLQLIISHSRSVSAEESGFAVAAEELSLWLSMLLHKGRQAGKLTFHLSPDTLASYMMRLFYDDLMRIAVGSDMEVFRELLENQTAGLLDVWLHGINS